MAVSKTALRNLCPTILRRHSHQLRVLRNLRLVRYRKEGKIVYYSLDDEHIESLFQQGLEHAQHG